MYVKWVVKELIITSQQKQKSKKKIVVLATGPVLE